jgi:hypothetical protein
MVGVPRCSTVEIRQCPWGDTSFPVNGDPEFRGSRGSRTTLSPRLATCRRDWQPVAATSNLSETSDAALSTGRTGGVFRENSPRDRESVSRNPGTVIRYNSERRISLPRDVRAALLVRHTTFPVNRGRMTPPPPDYP